MVGVVDPVSTVSSRIALLPANVCHVWHTRRGRPCTAARVCAVYAARVRVRVRTCALFSRVTFAASRRDTRVSYNGESHVIVPNARTRF